MASRGTRAGSPGLAKWSTPSTGPETGTPWVTSARRSANLGWVSSSAMFERAAGRQVVDCDDVVAPVEEPAAEMRSEEPGAPRDDNSTHCVLTGDRRPRRRTRGAASRPDRAGCARRRCSAATCCSRTRSKSSQRNSSHSVSNATTSAPVGRDVRVGVDVEIGVEVLRLLGRDRIERAHNRALLPHRACDRHCR